MPEEVWGYLKTLTSADPDAKEFNNMVTVQGEWRRIDYSNTRGKSLTISTPFTALVDLSGAKIKKVTIMGKVVILDYSRAEIEVLDTQKAEIIEADGWKAKVGIKVGLI